MMEGEAGQTQLDGNRKRWNISEAAMQDAIQLAHQGKISAKNAWEVKLLEGMHDSVATKLNETNQDQYQQFQHCAVLVEGGAKVWTHRVENIYLLSIQTLNRMLRNNTKDEDGAAEVAEGEEGAATQVRRRKKTMERTLAESLDEIDAPETSNGGNEAVSALFRAMTEKFDQSHAAGLLLNNAPSGTVGNIILDRNEAEDDPMVLGTGQDTYAASDLQADLACTEDVTIGSPLAALGVRTSQELIDKSPNTVVPYVRPPEQEVEDDLGRSRATSVTSRVDQRLFNASRAASEFGGDEREDYDDGDMGDFGGDDGGDEEFNEAEDGPRSRIGSLARGLLSGRTELEELDQMALAAESHNEWVPLSQNVAPTGPGRKMGTASALLTNIRKQCLVPKTQADGQADKPKRRTGKTVTFSELTQAQAAGESTVGNIVVPTIEQLKMNKNDYTCVTPFAKDFLKRDPEQQAEYEKPSFCAAQAKNNRLYMSELYESFSTRSHAQHRRNDANNSATALLKEAATNNAGSESSTRSTVGHSVFFQPFCTLKESWSAQRKTVNHMNMARRALNPGGREYGENPHLQGAADDMPLMFDEDDDVDMGVDHDGPEYDDDVPLFNIPDGNAELPDLYGDGEEAELIQGPEVVKALMINRATVPTMVDVVKLRKTMWTVGSKLQEETFSQQRLAEPEPRSQSQASTPAAPPAGASRAARLLRKRGREYVEESPDRVEIPEDAPNTFSAMVAGTLPQAKQFSKDGTLSPAFFFFSALFLANEHGLRLKANSGEVLEDVELVEVDRLNQLTASNA